VSGIAKKRVVVAMSGGVDSSVAALLLVREGHEVLGVSMRLYSYEKEATQGCCAPEDLYEARRVADQLGIPHYVSDFEPVFEKNVIANFLESYRRGETPNPCARCNQDVKFSALLKRTRELGADFLATGHYARVERDGGRVRLLRARDRSRDQAYFLFGLTKEGLNRVLFPLGEITKVEVREIAREAGLKVADKPDSQEICFVSKDYASFVERKLAPGEIRPGNLVTEAGAILGRHTGIHQFTVGQRRGLGISSKAPMYVLAVHPGGDVVVGSNESLSKTTFDVRELSWVGDQAREGATVSAQIRSRSEPKEAVIEGVTGDRARVSFSVPQRAITPGQAAVFFDGEELLGGGWIDAVLP
jgi:tRNA-specific 2-thiouridylase